MRGLFSTRLEAVKSLAVWYKGATSISGKEMSAKMSREILRNCMVGIGYTDMSPSSE
jgi:hypothetical protein